MNPTEIRNGHLRLCVSLDLSSFELHCGIAFWFILVIGEVKHHLYVKRQTRICTTWSSFLLTCRLRFIISTRNLVVSRNFLSIRIVLSFFYQPVSYFEKCLTWIWRLPFAVYGKHKVSIKRFSRKLGHNLCPKTVPCATPKCPPVSKWLNLPPGKRQTKNMKLYLLQNITAAITATSSKTAITGPTTAPADSDPLTGSVGDWDCVTTT